MRKIFMTIVALTTLALTSCGNGKQSEATQDTVADAMPVEEVIANAAELVAKGDTIVVEGVCDHLCKHGGKKAFIVGAQESILRCESTAEMGGKFPQNSIHQPLIVKGILKEDRINEQIVKMMEESYAEQLKTQEAEHGEDVEVGCDTERKAAGQAELTKFADRMADHRAKIAASNLKDENGEPYYVQSYYIETYEYQIPEKK